MEQFKAAFRDFWKSVAWIEKASDGTEKVRKAIGGMVVLLAPLILGANKTGAEWATQLMPLVPWLLAIGGAYLIWQFAIAWDRNAGPIIQIGPPEVDDSYKCFDVPNRNSSAGTVYAQAYVQELCDCNDKRIPRIDSQIEVQFRGIAKGERAELHQGKPTWAVVLVAGDQGGIVCPFLWPPGDRMPTGKVAIPAKPLLPHPPPPFEEQKEVRFNLRIDFSDESGKRLKTKCQRYSLTPDPKSRTPYKLKPIR
jgi:hypothetical protein